MAFQLCEFQLFDNNGEPLNGGLVSVYDAGTTDEKDSFPTADDADAGTNANANPVVLDSAGRGQIWGRGGESYKLVIKTSASVTLDTRDDIAAPDVVLNARLKVYQASGSANAQTVTMDPALTSYTDSPPIHFIPVADNTGACTLNVNGLGAVSIKVIVDGVKADPYAGQIDASNVHVAQHDGTDFVLLNPVWRVSGSFTGTLTGVSGTVTGTVHYVRFGKEVTIDNRTLLSGTSNSTACTVTGLPSVITPSATTSFSIVRLVDNGAGTFGLARLTSGGAIEMFVGAAGSNFTGSGSKGLGIGQFKVEMA